MLEFIEDLGTRKEKGHSRRWCIAKCPFCGKLIERRTQQIKSIKSCGCKSSELRSKHLYKHNSCYTRLYKTWMDMKTRCNNPKNKRYMRYGGRGIKICEEWLDFTVFKEWALANQYDDTLTIDRVDNDGNYEPSNCEWVTIQENLKRRDRSRGWK